MIIFMDLEYTRHMIILPTMGCGKKAKLVDKEYCLILKVKKSQKEFSSITLSTIKVKF